MKAKSYKPRPARLPDARTLDLSLLGIERFYWDHASNALSPCSCDPAESGEPDPACELGHALYRLSASAKAGKLDDHTGSA